MRKTFYKSFFVVLALACSSSCARYNRQTTPTLIDTSVAVPDVAEEPISKIAIKARIRIESYTVALESRTGMQINTFDAVTIEQIERDLRRFEIEFEKLNLCIEVQSVEYIDPSDRVIIDERDLRAYDVLTRDTNPDDFYIYYIMSHGCIPDIIGYSVFPWNRGNSIFILGRMSDEYTFTHEMGHYLGLKHTFEIFGDGVSDTPDFAFDARRDDDFQRRLGDPFFDPNANNIMTYTTAAEQSFTDGQLERVRFYLETDRAEQIGELSPDYDLGLVLRSANNAHHETLRQRVISLNPKYYPLQERPTVEP
jgi:hypothetical protein